MLASLKLSWLIDQGLPQVQWVDPDTLPLSQAGGSLLQAAAQTKRWAVTQDRRLLEAPASGSPTIVVLSSGPWTEEGLARNLLHFQFCLARNPDLSGQPQEGQRFLVEMDRRIYRLRPEGGVEELEAWKGSSLNPDKSGLVVSAPA